MDSIYVKDKLIKDVAASLSLSEQLVHTIIAFQGEHAAQMSHKYREIEFSGFGKFYLSKTRMKRDLINYEKYLNKPGEKPEDKVERMQKVVDFLKTKLEDETN
jgi:nucleoid DNA-binding protein